MRATVLAALTLTVVASLAAGGSATITPSGLRGIVMRGPTSPICHVGDPCEEPAKGLLLQFRRDGRIVKQVRTSRTGRYRVLLRRGRYAVTTPGLRAPARLQPQLVAVPRGRIVRRDFQLDTGVQ